MGDIIVVWVVYCFVQLILGGKNSYAVAFGTMIFAFGVEFLQKMKTAANVNLAFQTEILKKRALKR